MNAAPEPRTLLVRLGAISTAPRILTTIVGVLILSTLRGA